MMYYCREQTKNIQTKPKNLLYDYIIKLSSQITVKYENTFLCKIVYLHWNF